MKNLVWMVGLLIVMILGPGVRAQGGGVDLGKRYPATLDYDPNGKAYDWTCGEGDVWRLKSFNFVMKDAFTVETGAAQVVFGCHESDVLWAAVLPEQPGRLTRKGIAGEESVTSIWLRLNPARVGELFPAATVIGPGSAVLLMGRRLAAFKMGSSWQSGGKPMVPARGSLTVDMETRGGPRRFFSVDTEKGTTQYVAAFEARRLPVTKPLDAAAATKAFEEVWQAFDREYAMFAIKPQVDWTALSGQYAPRAAAARSTYELAAVLGEMLANLEDLHVHVSVGGEFIPGFNRERLLNGNFGAAQKLIGTLKQPGRDLLWGRTDDGLGYINITGLSNEQLPKLFDDALAQLADTRGLIIDLRYNGGGSERLAQQITGRLLDKRAVYSYSQFRSGPKHGDLTGKEERTVAPRGPWRYTAPVMTLQGRVTMSSAESFALMLAQCPQVTTMGDNTAGSSGNPRQLTVAGDITVNLPRWIDLDPAGKPLDVVGYPPRMKIEAKAEDFKEGRDPVLEAALAQLRKVAPEKAPPREKKQ